MINRKFWVVYFVLCIVLISAFGVLGVYRGDDRWFLMLAATIVVIVPAIFQLIQRESELFTPVNLIFISVFFGTWVQLSIYLFQDDLRVPIALDSKTDFEMIVVGLVASLLGVFSLLVGYSAGSETGGRPQRPKSASEIQFLPKRALIIGVVVFLLSSVLLAIYLKAVGFSEDVSRFSVKRSVEEGGGTLESLARYGFRFAQGGCLVFYFGMLLLKKQGSRVPKGLAVIIGLLFVIGCLGPFLTSSRSALLYFIISMFALNHFLQGKWGMRQLKLAAIVCSVIILGMGALRYMQQRDVSIDSYSEDVGVSGLVRSIGLSNNFMGISKTAVLIDSVPSREAYRFGQTYVLWLLAPIPRSLWADKPIVRIGGELGPSVFGTSEASGIPPGFIGESFLNFSWLGPILVGGLMGFLIGRVTRVCLVGSLAGVVGLFAYSTILPLSFSIVSADFTGTVIRLMQITLPVLLVFKFVFKERPVIHAAGQRL